MIAPKNLMKSPEKNLNIIENPESSWIISPQFLPKKSPVGWIKYDPNPFLKPVALAKLLAVRGSKWGITSMFGENTVEETTGEVLQYFSSFKLQTFCKQGYVFMIVSFFSKVL